MKRKSKNLTLFDVILKKKKHQKFFEKFNSILNNLSNDLVK